jgi:hypothetical protein
MQLEAQSEQAGFHAEFKYDGRQYIADIKYPYPINEKEQKAYKVEDGEFLVHLIDDVGSRSFKVFLNENLEWVTDSPSLLIEPELATVIGELIDSKLG